MNIFVISSKIQETSFQIVNLNKISGRLNECDALAVTRPELVSNTGFIKRTQVVLTSELPTSDPISGRGTESVWLQYQGLHDDKA